MNRAATSSRAPGSTRTGPRFGSSLVRKNPSRGAVSFGLLAFIVGSLSVAMFWRHMPTIATNRYVQATVVTIGLLVIGARYGWNANQRHVEDIDELVLQIGDYVLPVKGLHVPGGRKKPPRFLPSKGYRRSE